LSEACTAPRVRPSLPGPGEPAPAAGVLRHLGLAGCVKLPLRVDAAALATELERLPRAVWSATVRDPVVLADVESFFVVGAPRGTSAPLPGTGPLATLPALADVLHAVVPAPPVRAIVQRLRAGGMVPLHRDTHRHFARTVRVSICVAAGDAQGLFCDGAWYAMAPGEVWALDNLSRHGVLNDALVPRVNVIADYAPDAALLALLHASEQGRGVRDDAATATLTARSRRHYRARRWQSLRYELGKLFRRRTPAADPQRAR